MRDDLSPLTRELRRETCPRHVLDAVERKIKGSAPRRSRLARPALALALILICGLLAWHWQATRRSPQQTSLALNADDRARIVDQTENALALVGSVLRDAKLHSEQIFSDRAVPPLRNSFQTTKNKIIRLTP